MIVKISRQKEHSNMIMVTSALSGEGKSVTSLNVAITLSQEYNYTTLLIDSDFRRPSLAKLLKIDVDKGLSDCLLSGNDVGSVMINTGIGRLSFLPAGKPIENPVELFSSDQMKQCMDEMKNRYRDRIIIIDTPPALPFAETRFITELSDKVILVAQEGTASLQNLSETIDIIGHSNILGVVYNNAKSDGINNNFNYYYARYRYQNKGE